MTTTEKSLTDLLPSAAIPIAKFIGRLLFLLLVIAVCGAGIMFASARLEYDLKYEEIASPVLHYLALLSFTLLPAVMILTAVAKKRETALAMLVVCTVLLVVSIQG